MKTNEKFIKEVFELVADEYTFLEEYKGATTKIKVRHNSYNCNNHEYEVRPNDFLHNRRCPKCSGKFRRTKEEFISELNEKFPNEYEILSEFNGMTKKVELQHKVCGHIWKISPSNLLRSESSCPNCKFTKLANLYRMDFNVVKNNIESEGFLLLSNEYKNAKTKLDLQCLEGHLFSTDYNHFQQGQRCPQCAIIRNTERQRTPVEDIEKQVTERGFTLISWEGTYVNTQSKFTLKCSKGHITTKSVGSFQQGCDCPHCKKISKGEKVIKSFLETNDILHEYQYEFEDCKNIRPLPFDFAILNDDNTVKFLIEYDGEQHFYPVEIFGGIEKFEQNKRHDGIKNDYCDSSDIKLIRIPYTELNNLDNILNELFFENLIV